MYKSGRGRGRGYGGGQHRGGFQSRGGYRGRAIGGRPARKEKEVDLTQLTINERLQLNLHEPVKLEPRRYQQQLYEEALRQNVIIFLGTGLGKTFIVVMYANSAELASQLQAGRKVVFLAPTQDLVKQQAEYLNKQIPYRVKIFCGRTSRAGLHIDHWDKTAWDTELTKVDFLFMTPQIFSAAIGTSLLRWESFAAVIFDEVHHACSSKAKATKHPYMQALSHYNVYYACRADLHRPRLVGLTASLINSMPKDRAAIRAQIAQLEKCLHAKCVTDLEVQGHVPKMILWSHTYFEYSDLNDMLTQMFVSVKRKFEEALKLKKVRIIQDKNPSDLTQELRNVLSYHNRLKLAAAGFSIKPGSLPDVLDGLLAIRRRCGLWSLRSICDKIIVALSKQRKSPLCAVEVSLIYEDFIAMLKNVVTMLEIHLSKSEDNGLFKETNAKPKALLDVLKSEYLRATDSTDNKSTFSCVIFIRSRLEVVALNEWIQTVSSTKRDYEFIRSDYAIGLAAALASKYSCITKRKPKEQHKMLENFRNGGLNCIVTTSVLEEGIDLPTCSTVIRYDQPNNFREYVQSRGRARQDVSSFVTLCEISNLEAVQDKLDKFNDFEHTLREGVEQNDVGPRLRRTEQVTQVSLDDDDCFLTRDDSVRIDSTIAKTILNMYCNQLKLRSPFSGGIQYTFEQESSLWRATLYLPSSCPLPTGIKGGFREDEETAINSAAVAAIKVLYEAGELDERAVPRRPNAGNLQSLLKEADLEQPMEPLDKSLEGYLDGTTHCFEPRLHQIEHSLARNSAERTYKLIRLRFEPDAHKSRQDTRHLFGQSVLGLIVDSSLSNDFLPKLMFSHYGQMYLQAEVVNANLSITNAQDHAIYLNYTFKLLTRCLSIRGFNKEAFRQKCLLYVVRLTDDNKPDLVRMSRSFDGPNFRVRENDVVRLGAYFNQSSTNRRLADDSGSLMVVRRIRRDLNAHSLIPGMNLTFADDARRRYNLVVEQVNQPVLEVMPIAKAYGSIKEFKREKRDTYRTSSLFYLEQYVDYFSDDAALILQAFNLPEIIYRVYLQHCMAELSGKLLSETADQRTARAATIAAADKPVELVGVVQPGELEQRPQREERPPKLGDSGDKLEPSGEDEGGDDDDDSASSASSEEPTDLDVANSDYADTDYEDEDGWPKYSDMVSRQTLSTNTSSTDHMAKFDMRLYKVVDLRRLSYTHRSSSGLSGAPVMAGLDPRMEALRKAYETYADKCMALLAQFEIQMSSELALDEEAELAKEFARVDSSIKAPISLDVFTPPAKRPSRERALLEALTTCRAQESYNLERLESLGDSFLKYITTVVLYKKLLGSEGLLTSARSELTNNVYFNYLAKRRRLGNYAVTSAFTREHLSRALGAPTRDPKKPIQNRMRPKDLADTFESVVGAFLYYYGDFEAIMAIEWLGLDIFKDKALFSVFSERSVAFAKAETAYIKTDDLDLVKYRHCCERKYRRFQQIISYTFRDPSFLIQAFNHSTSMTKVTPSYERLEFLGDAILDYLVTRTLLAARPHYNPGQISQSRSALVNNWTFAKLALQYKFDLFISYCELGIYDAMTKVRLVHDEDPDADLIECDELDEVIKLLADVFESLAGAIYLDSGCSLDAVWSVFYPMMESIINQEIEHPSKNPIQELYELYPSRVSFEFFKVRTGDDGNQEVDACACKVTAFGEFEGTGRSKRQARLRAVLQALHEHYETQQKKRPDKSP